MNKNIYKYEIFGRNKGRKTFKKIDYEIYIIETKMYIIFLLEYFMKN